MDNGAGMWRARAGPARCKPLGPGRPRRHARAAHTGPLCGTWPAGGSERNRPGNRTEPSCCGARRTAGGFGPRGSSQGRPPTCGRTAASTCHCGHRLMLPWWASPHTPRTGGHRSGTTFPRPCVSRSTRTTRSMAMLAFASVSCTAEHFVVTFIRPKMGLKRPRPILPPHWDNDVIRGDCDGDEHNITTPAWARPPQRVWEQRRSVALIPRRSVARRVADQFCRACSAIRSAWCRMWISLGWS